MTPKFGVVTFFAAVLLAITGVSHPTIIALAGLPTGVFASGVRGFVLLRAEHRMLPGQLRLNGFMQVLLIISSVAGCGTGVFGPYQFLAG